MAAATAWRADPGFGYQSMMSFSDPAVPLGHFGGAGGMVGTQMPATGVGKAAERLEVQPHFGVLETGVAGSGGLSGPYASFSDMTGPIDRDHTLRGLSIVANAVIEMENRGSESPLATVARSIRSTDGRVYDCTNNRLKTAFGMSPSKMSENPFKSLSGPVKWRPGQKFTRTWLDKPKSAPVRMQPPPAAAVMPLTAPPEAQRVSVHASASMTRKAVRRPRQESSWDHDGDDDGAATALAKPLFRNARRGGLPARKRSRSESHAPVQQRPRSLSNASALTEPGSGVHGQRERSGSSASSACGDAEEIWSPPASPKRGSKKTFAVGNVVDASSCMLCGLPGRDADPLVNINEAVMHRYRCASLHPGPPRGRKRCKFPDCNAYCVGGRLRDDGRAAKELCTIHVRAYNASPLVGIMGAALPSIYCRRCWTEDSHATVATWGYRKGGDSRFAKSVVAVACATHKEEAMLRRKGT